MLFTLGAAALWNFLHLSKSHDISITAFVLTGYSTILLWRNMPSRCVNALQPNYSLLYHRQVTPLAVYISRLALEAAGATASFVLLTMVFLALGLISPPEDIVTLFSAWLLLAWYAVGFSLTLGVISERSEIIEKLWHPLMYIIIPMSGAFWLVESLPIQLQKVVLYFPTVHCTEMFRAGYFGPGHIWHYDTLYVVACNLVLTLLGLSLVRGLRVAPTN
jgi:capsular polysaccharide transport system permease protein